MNLKRLLAVLALALPVGLLAYPVAVGGGIAVQDIPKWIDQPTAWSDSCYASGTTTIAFVPNSGKSGDGGARRSSGVFLWTDGAACKLSFHLTGYADADTSWFKFPADGSFWFPIPFDTLFVYRVLGAVEVNIFSVGNRPFF
jgi:hypothetical protein